MAADWDCPDAELVMAPEEMWGSRETWLAERRLGIGGSDVASLMGDGKYADSTQYDVWLDKTGRIPEKDPTLAMEMGNDFEDAVAMRFARATGLEIQPQGLLRSRISSVILNSPDRLTSASAAGWSARPPTSTPIAT
jgi:predicted phage-related endonuclease